jgi:transposase
MPQLVQLVGDEVAQWRALAQRYRNIVAHLTEDPPTHFHEVAVSRDARGTYFCSFVYDDSEQRGDDDPHKKARRRKERKQRLLRTDGVAAFDLGIKTLATGYTDQGRFYHIGGFRGYRYYNKQLDKIRSKRDKCKKKEEETPKERRKRHIRNRLVYNDWGLYGFVQMLAYKCLRFGKELLILGQEPLLESRGLLGNRPTNAHHSKGKSRLAWSSSFGDRWIAGTLRTLEDN